MVIHLLSKKHRLLRQCLETTTRLLQSFTGPSPHPQQRRKLAFLIGVNYSGRGERWRLKGPQADVVAMKTALIGMGLWDPFAVITLLVLILYRVKDVFQFSEEDIVVLSDCETVDDDHKPTQQNVMRELQRFVRRDLEADYVFVFSGHSSQRNEEGHRVEADGLEEYIIPCDAVTSENQPEFDEERIIPDKVLNEFLIQPLMNGSQLLAIFDSCHSGTLLNLRHYKCNRLGKWTSAVRRAGCQYLCDPFGVQLIRKLPAGSPRDMLPWRLRKPGTEVSTGSSKSNPGICTGFCCHFSTSEKRRVFCISACKDSQIIYETPEGESMIQSIVALLKVNRRPSLKELMHAAQENAHKICDGANESMRNSSKGRRLLGTLIQRRKAVQQWDPQLSSLRPLNMNYKLVL
ncbi:caspase domain-containing protein [Flammula alnicola]|nr:caspase domain-containing protein [Flammula alnicola]